MRFSAQIGVKSLLSGFNTVTGIVTEVDNVSVAVKDWKQRKNKYEEREREREREREKD